MASDFIQNKETIESLPFDVYSKNFIVKKIIDTDFPNISSILDVGGRNGSLKDFFADKQVYVIDPQKNDLDHSTNYIRGFGDLLPIGDSSVDGIVTLDVLEHVPAEKRERFINELFRVAKEFVIIAAPFNTDEVFLAENYMNELYISMSGHSHPMLDEHLGNALPDQSCFENIIKEYNYPYNVYYNNNLYNWMLMQGTLQFSHNNQFSGSDLTNLFRFYNHFFLQLQDQTPPVYRHIYVIYKTRDLPPEKKMFGNTDKSDSCFIELIFRILTCYYNNSGLTSAEIVTYKKMLTQKDEYIHSLKESLDQKNENNQSLKNTLIIKDKYINSIKEDLDQKDEYINSLIENLDQKDEYINSLIENLDQKDEYINSLKGNLDQKDEYINSIKGNLDQKDVYINSLKGNLDQKDEYINSLKGSLIGKILLSNR